MTGKTKTGSGRPSRLRSAAAIGSVAGLLAMTPVAADPAGGVLERADATLRVQAKNKIVYVVSIAVERITSRQTADLVVSVQTCDRSGECNVPVNHLTEITAEEFEMAPDAASATLASSFAGVPLEIQWSSAGPSVVADASIPQQVSLGLGGGASVNGQLLGVTCHGFGNVEHAALVAAERQSPQEDKEWPEVLPKPLRKGPGKCAA